MKGVARAMAMALVLCLPGLPATVQALMCSSSNLVVPSSSTTASRLATVMTVHAFQADWI